MIRPLTPADAPAFCALRKESYVSAPLSWDHDPGAEVLESVWAPRLQQTDDDVVLGFFLTEGRSVPELAGVIGLKRFAKRKRRHRALIWGVYVSPAARGQRAAQRMVAEALAYARRMEGLDHVILSVSHRSPAAVHIYQSAGFTEWGREVRAARSGEIWMDEIHMRLEMSGAE